MKHVCRWAVATAVAFVFGTGCIAAEAEFGLKIGQKAPDFSLQDQNGTERSLGEMLKSGQVAIVFHRSADW